MRQRVMIAAPLVLAAAVAGCRSREAPPPAGYRVPPGFAIEPAASPGRLGPLSTFTFDSRGRPVVVKERGGLATLLLDNNQDGVFETEKVLTTAVHAVRGLWFDARVLYLLGTNAEGQYGLYRLEDRNNDDEMDNLEQLSVFEEAAPPAAAGAHDIRRGPDGAPTLLQGDKWIRWGEDHRVLASGFANPRAHAYDSDGEAIVLDSGAVEESDPWLSRAASRLVHAVPGGEYGASGFHFDLLPALGGPAIAAAGIVFYQHNTYPEDFRGALFHADGGRGRIGARRMVRAGATWQASGPVVGEFTSGEPLNITGIEVGPDGFVYFSVGGSASRGGLYRIRYSPGWRERWERRPARLSDELAIVRQPQPLSSWGHAALYRQHELLEARWGEDLEILAHRTQVPAGDRAQAILLLLRFGPKPKPALLKSLMADANPRLRAAALYAAGQLRNGGAAEVVEQGLRDPDAFVRRRAAEALTPEMALSPYPLLSDPDRFVRFAARRALERLPREDWKPRVLGETARRPALEGMLALIRTASGRLEQDERQAVIEKLLPMLADPNLESAVRLDALRLLVLAADEVKDAALENRAREVLLRRFPAGGGDIDAVRLNRETARALSWCGGTEAIQKILEAMATAGQERPLQVYYAQCLRLVKEGWTAAQKEAMLQWFAQAAEWKANPGSPIPTRSLSQLFNSFIQAALTRVEGRQARKRIPKLAGATASSLTADEIFDLQTAEPPPAPTPGKGRDIFETKCASCHRLGKLGNEAGPELTEVGQRLDRTATLEAILWPSREIADRYGGVRVDLADGSSLEAFVVREDDKLLVLKTASDPRLISIFKNRVTGRQKLDRSIMPEGLLDGDDQGAIADLLEFLAEGAKVE